MTRPPPSPRSDSLSSHRTCPSFPGSHVRTFCVFDAEPINVRLEALGAFDLPLIHRLLLFITPNGAYGGSILISLASVETLMLRAPPRPRHTRPP